MSIDKKKVITWILAFFFFIILFTGSIRSVIFDKDFYEKEFIKNNIDVDNHSSITDDLIFFLKDRHSDISYISSFNDIEQEHLIEVRDMIHMILLIFNVAVLSFIIFLFILYYIERSNFFCNVGNILFYGGTLSTSIIFLLSLIAFNFRDSFIYFHKLFFETQWMFPSSYLLIQLFPQQFFADAFLNILLRSVFTSVIAGMIGYTIITKQK